MNIRMLKCLYKRDRQFNIFYVGILVLQIVAFVSNSISGLSYDSPEYNYSMLYHVMFEYLINTYMLVLLLSVLIMQTLRFSLYESSHYLDTFRALPITKKDRITYDLITGFAGIGMVSLIDTAICLLSCVIFNSVYYDYELFLYCIFTVYMILSSLIMYSLFILAKNISCNYIWTAVLSVTLYIVAYAFQSIVQGRADIYLHVITFNYNTSILILILLSVLLTLCVFIIYIISKHVNESKGGAYRFKSVQLFVSLTITVTIFGLLYSAGDYNATAHYKVLYNLFVTIFSVAAFAGLCYLTAPKKR